MHKTRQYSVPQWGCFGLPLQIQFGENEVALVPNADLDEQPLQRILDKYKIFGVIQKVRLGQCPARPSTGMAGLYGRKNNRKKRNKTHSQSSTEEKRSRKGEERYGFTALFAS